MKKRIPGALALLGLSLFLAGCSSKTDKIQEEGDRQEALMEQEQEEPEEEQEKSEETEADQKVTVLLAGKRGDENSFLREKLREEGYQVQIRYAGMDAKTQEEQLREAVEEQTQAVVLEPVALYGMEDVLQEAGQAGIGIVSYGRLLMDTEHVDAYVTYDAYEQGTELGSQTEERLELKEHTAEDPVTIEIFLGGGEDRNDEVFCMGLLEVLSPYLEEGTLVSRAGRDTLQEMEVKDGSAENAGDELGQLLETSYEGEAPDVICVSADALAQGICKALEKAGYKAPAEEDSTEKTEEDSADRAEAGWPLVMGGRLSVQAANRIGTGRQALAFYQDTEGLADACARALEEYFAGEISEDVSMEYDNGVQIVPAYTAETVPADASGYESYLEDLQAQ